MLKPHRNTDCLTIDSTLHRSNTDRVEVAHANSSYGYCVVFLLLLKVAVSRDFLATFFSLIEPTQAHNTQAKMVLLTNSISRRYSNFLVSQPIKNLTKNFGLCRNSSLLFLNKFRILFQGKERLAKTKLMPAKQCQPAQWPTPHSVSHFWICKNFQ